ncbi:MAG: zinc ribbon domain-containing protein [Nitrospinota bacterium]|nr:zinc ribbon domain-containing protein [Nitrospinota bacterium]
MPMYEFRCEKCGEKFERLLPYLEAKKTQECPRCEKLSGKRVVSAPSVSASQGSGGFGGGGCGPTGFG